MGYLYPKLSILAVLVIILSSSSVFSQDVAFNDEKILQLTNSIDQIEYSSTVYLPKMVSKQELSFLVKTYNSPLTTIELKNGQLELSLEKRMKPDWTSKDWNNYLFSLYQKTLTDEK